MTALPARNLLGDETSPYLLLHKDDPVNWRPWGPEALAEAKETGKPILLSSGYLACHWCHVMKEESFRDPEIAALMNERFVCIKLDRDERPEIDSLYQAALQAVGIQGGWPLTAFLNADGEFFAGGTYFSPAEQEGRPSFRSVLDNVQNAIEDRGQQLATNIANIKQALTNLWHADQPKPVTPGIIDPIARQATNRIDRFFGGFAQTPKFPQIPVHNLVWRAFLRTAAAPFGQAVSTTLDNMCQGGVYDHLGGGFHRYSVDERWLQPHFEKMLSDNAGLIELMTLAWQHIRSPLYAARVDETVDWVLREMVTKEGAFAGALDSDSEGEEGRFYVWTEAEIDEVLGPNEAPFFKQVYGVVADGNWNRSGRNILHRLNAMMFLRPDQEAVLTRNRRMLLMARAKRIRPGIDDKLMPDVNGMMIAALVQAGAVFKKAEWHFAAVRAFWAIAEKLGEGDRLAQTWRERPSRNEATADGYAQMSRAALLLYEFTGDQRYLDKARAWAERLENEFRDSQRGGYFLSAASALDVPVRAKTALDQGTPNYNGVINEVLAKLFFITGEDSYRDRSNLLLAAAGAEVDRQTFGTATLLNSLEFIVNGIQVVILGDERSPDTQALVRAVLERSLPTRLLTLLRPGQKLHAKHPAHGKALEGGKPTAYVVVGQNCSPPITNPSQLANGLLSPPFRQLMEAQAAQLQAQQAANNR